MNVLPPSTNIKDAHHMSTAAQFKSAGTQLNTFSTLVSIMAVIISIIITLGGYFATSATTVEKIDRLEKQYPKLESTVDSILREQYKDALTRQQLESKLDNHLENYEREMAEFRIFRKESNLSKQKLMKKEGILEEKIRQIENKLKR